ncbi:MAG: hypothetical protein ABSA82_03185 [Thermacetogeniaceae bacterium]|jgi:hypothetical protein
MKEIEVRLPRCTLILTEAEILQLLKSNIGIWQTALVRGKAVMRARQAEKRQKLFHVK